MTTENTLRPLLVGIAALATACTAGAEPARHVSSEPPLAGVFQVGRTGIHCVKEPCPRRGIIHLDSKSRWPLWRKDTLPQVVADRATRERLQKAWDDHGCLRARGRFDGETLSVDEIVEEC